MEQNSISISQFVRRGLRSATCYNDDILVTNHVEYLSPFRHPCRLNAMTFLVCLGGTVDCRVNLRHYHVEKGSVVVISTGDIIHIEQVSQLEAYAVVISSEYLSDLQIDFQRRAIFHMDIRQNAMVTVPMDEIRLLRPYYDLLKGCIDCNREERHEVMRGLVRAFSYTVISLMRTHQQKENASATTSRNQEIFDRFMSSLVVHHINKRGVRFYADLLCLTPNYLSDAVRECSGKSAMKWINDYVVTEAKIMLKNTDESIKEIAYRLNFPTQSAFGKYFKQQTGIGPKAYREA